MRITREVEDAAAELGRLDATAAVAPPGLALALRLAATEAACLLAGEPVGLEAFAAAAASEIHEAALPPRALGWRSLLADEERRVRTGAPLVAARLTAVEPTLATYSERPRLEAVWKEAGAERSVLVRALDAAAWAPTEAVAEVGAALVLCAGGLADRVRFLPFLDVPAAARAPALAAWREDEHGAWRAAALRAAAQRARAVRRAVEALLRGLPQAERTVDALGRGRLLAHRAHALLQATFVTTMPALAEVLDCSRPAAADALDRLVEAGVARELTGRARDRVYGWAAAATVAAASRTPVGT